MNEIKKPSLVVIVHNIRSCHNVGSILRTADGLGVNKVYLTGYTPYPKQENDLRLPHQYERINKQVNKTALGAELSVDWEYHQDPGIVIKNIKNDDYVVCALEQNTSSVSLPDFIPHQKTALLLGEEVSGVSKNLLAQCDSIIEIPMVGSKESYNVAQAFAMASYHILWCHSFVK